jgi:hypothetical protein
MHIKKYNKVIAKIYILMMNKSTWEYKKIFTVICVKQALKVPGRLPV